MAERGDLIGCTVLFEMAENGEVPISFTLNGKPVTQARISITISQEDSLLFPFVSMGHEGVAVSAKVSNNRNPFLRQYSFQPKLWRHDNTFSTNPTTSIPSSLFASCLFLSFPPLSSMTREAQQIESLQNQPPVNGLSQDMEEWVKTIGTAETYLDIMKHLILHKETWKWAWKEFYW